MTLQGRVANFVETEQLIEMSSPKGSILSSFVQVRGSIPLMWSQIPNIKYKPTTRIAPPETYSKAFDRHVTDLLDVYKVCRLLQAPVLLQTSTVQATAMWQALLQAWRVLQSTACRLVSRSTVSQC